MQLLEVESDPRHSLRQFLLRGVNLVSGEWDLVCLAYNVKRMHRMQYI